MTTLQCQKCRKEQKHDTKDIKNWPECHGVRMPVLRRTARWPDVPFQCPRCGSMGVEQKPMGSFNQGSCAVRYACGTMLVSDLGSPWYVGMYNCVKWDWEARHESNPVSDSL